MIHTTRGRVAVLVGLLVAQGVLVHLFAVQLINRSAGVVPETATVTERPATVVGEKVYIEGRVRQVFGTEVVVETSAGEQHTVVLDEDVSPTEGAKLRVYGTLIDTETTAAITHIEAPQRGLWYTWSVSLVGAFWTLSRFFRHWRVVPSSLAVERRQQPLSHSDLVRMGDSDA